MPKRTNLKFFLWVVGVALFAFVAGRFVEPGIVGANNKTTITQTTGRGHVSSGQAPSTVQPTQPSAGRGAATQPAETLSVSELYRLITEQPQTIRTLIFVNGKHEVIVERDGKPKVTVKVPDDGGKQDLRTKALNAKIAIAVQEFKVDPVLGFMQYMGPALLIVGVIVLIYFLQRRQAMNAGRGVGASKAKDASTVDVIKTRFRDVAGCDEAIKELRRVVQGLVGREMYTRFGAELPRGILLVGPPGTGKTLLAKAVAGEAEGSFDITSGSDFVEMYVGVGASRVRDMFTKARAKVAESSKPHIIFIDEIDAVGGKRGGGASQNSNSEREQTLNAILVEMDGMVSNEGIIVIAATNRVDMLDDALLRPGRFDAHVTVDLPDKSGREAIFAIHLANKTLARTVTLSGLAHRTFGYSGAEIKGVTNRAAILAAERYAKARHDLEMSGVSAAEIAKQLPAEITLEDFDEGIDFVRYGNASPSKQRNMNKKDITNTAYHEAGHACVSQVFPDSDPVVKITILRRSRALGYVQYMPENDRVSFTREQAIARMVTAMAGRAAQEKFLGTVDTGASNDFEQATDIARKMVTLWGMSELGRISVGDRQPGPFAGSGGGHAGVGPALADEIDRVWRQIVEDCYQAAKAIIEADSARIEKLAQKLLEKETVLADEFRALCEEAPSQVDIKSIKLP